MEEKPKEKNPADNVIDMTLDSESDDENSSPTTNSEDEMPKQYPSSQNGNDDIIPLEVVVKNPSTSFQKIGKKCPHCHQFMDVNGNIEDHLCRKAAEYIHSQGQTFHCLLCDMNFQNRL